MAESRAHSWMVDSEAVTSGISGQVKSWNDFPSCIQLLQLGIHIEAAQNNQEHLRHLNRQLHRDIKEDNCCL
jgi:hypothetical protein